MIQEVHVRRHVCLAIFISNHWLHSQREHQREKGAVGLGMGREVKAPLPLRGKVCIFIV